ncbi:MAG: hypothetical protein ACI9TH_003665 [Kiritimatiellia bacterium]|jgi:hypothetical protein
MVFSRFSKLLRINRTVKGGGRGKSYALPKDNIYRPRLTYMKQQEFNQEFFTDLRGSGKGLRR